MTLSKEEEIKNSFKEQEKKYGLPSDLLKKIYDTETEYLRQTSRSVSKKQIMQLILESVPKEKEELEKLLKKHLEEEGE